MPSMSISRGIAAIRAGGDTPRDTEIDDIEMMLRETFRLTTPPARFTPPNDAAILLTMPLYLAA